MQNIFQVNTDLPKLPVPDLQHTLVRYLEALQPILGERDFAQTKKIVENFGAEGGDGESIQQSLVKRREELHNWVSFMYNTKKIQQQRRDALKINNPWVSLSCKLMNSKIFV